MVVGCWDLMMNLLSEVRQCSKFSDKYVLQIYVTYVEVFVPDEFCLPDYVICMPISLF